MSGESHGETRILVVDDEKLILLTMSAMLKRAGYTPVTCDNVDTAVKMLRENKKGFSAVITDIMMGNMDGFMFRDIVRGVDKSLPILFLTALDPEEGGGFLKRILDDSMSFYLPKAIKSDVLLRRIQRIVASRRVELFIETRMEEDRQANEIAAHIQRRMLPVGSMVTGVGFYSTLWFPKELVSGDLYEAVPYGDDACLFLLGDIQGHGTSAALTMTAVQSFVKQLSHREGAVSMAPSDIANILQKFFRANLAGVSYMTALICIHRPLKHEVEWLSCGAPDLVVVDGGARLAVNPEKRGGVPIGFVPDAVYTEADVVRTELTDTALCFAYTDGLLDIYSDASCTEPLSDELRNKLVIEILWAAHTDGSIMSALGRVRTACETLGYTYTQDDITMLVFGSPQQHKGIYEATVPLSPSDIDAASQAMGDWCRAEGWDDCLIGRVQVVFEEKLMNVYDHGFDEYDRLHEVVSIRLRLKGASAELSVWDGGTPEPSIKVVAGDSSTVFDKANIELHNHGRGRLMVRELCRGIRRECYGDLNETVYYIPVVMPAGDGEKEKEDKR